MTVKYCLTVVGGLAIIAIGAAQAVAEPVDKTVIRKVEDATSDKGYVQLEVSQRFDTEIWRYEKFQQKGLYPGDVFTCIKPDVCRKGTKIYTDYWKLSLFKTYDKKTIRKLPISDTSINRDFVNLVFWKAKILQLIPTSVNSMKHLEIMETPYIRTNISTTEKTPREINGFTQLKSWPVAQFTTIKDGLAILTTVVYGASNPTKSLSENDLTPTIVDLIENQAIKVKSQ